MFFETNVIIHARPEEVWGALKDWMCATRWMLGVERSWLVEQTVGEGVQLAVRAGGVDWELSVVAWEPEERLALHARHGGIAAECELLLEDLDQDTELTVELWCQGRGLRSRLAALSAGWRTARAGRDGLDALKRVIEMPAGRGAGVRSRNGRP